MHTIIHRAAVLAGIAVLALSTPVAAQDFPNKPVRVFTPFAPGNTLDTALRIVSEKF